MFVGHYAASLALKSVNKKASLGMLFLAVQLVDIIFFPLVLLGVERFNIIENFTQSTHFELEYMPYTHSLLASFIWAGLIYAIYRFTSGKTKIVALVMGIAVLSHWFLDLIVHTPDLPLWSDASMKVGFGLWDNAIATYTLEALLLIAGIWIYLRATTALTGTGKYAMGIFVAVMLLINAVNIFGPLVDSSKLAMAVSTLILYFLFAIIAQWLDGKRR
jgi:hypothetical protein